jgi:hypothetical protein
VHQAINVCVFTFMSRKTRKEKYKLCARRGVGRLACLVECVRRDNGCACASVRYKWCCKGVEGELAGVQGACACVLTCEYWTNVGVLCKC